MFELDIQVVQDDPQLPTEAQCLSWLAAAQAELIAYDADEFSDQNYAITLRFVDALESQQLNETYRGINKPTNVLSFPVDDWDEAGLPAELLAELGTPHVGDLVFCVPVMSAEAQEMAISPEAHWAHLLVHGYLHLHGFDHLKDDEAALMEGLESKIMCQLGFADPYSEAELAD
ncbi:peptidase [Thiomicrospira aerophila AL3]|uniref:Endoribonuclease YbeY n=1 Tax=Thiomicrospira aerophila AL3 TaxID=717772 RepID=W0DU12_9GAMM|nr:rRNA maturation RNase YbeY [Thiomicrospira aerophila]AHF00743.1 peptidase [Thiomicrospira aerophila AL3]